MGRNEVQSMKNMQEQDTDKLFEAVLKIENMDECRRFFEDLCTIQEIRSMAQRVEVAHLLRQKLTYQDIAHRTGASTATISRVNRCLVYGADGYTTVLDRVEESENDDD